MADAIQNFVSKAPWIMRALMEDFGFSVEDAAAACGNGGHESNGLQAINEAKPTVAGSRGGWGWFQWTGSRRVAFENYCARNGLSPSSDRAQYNWLFLELQGTEAKAVQATKDAEGLEAKVEAFEKAYERAGVKHYPSRLKWAERALTAWATASEEAKTKPWERGQLVAPQPVPHTPILAGGVGGAVVDIIRDQVGEAAGKAIGGTVGGIVRDAIQNDPDPDQGKSPIEKVIGAGKGATIGGVSGAAMSGAIVYLMGAYGLVPEGTDGAALGVAITTIITTVSTGLSAMIGTYMAKKNAPS